jgi:hypothetical protein
MNIHKPKKQLSPEKKLEYNRNIEVYLREMLNPSFGYDPLNGVKIVTDFDFKVVEFHFNILTDEQNNLLKQEFQKFLYIIVDVLSYFNPDTLGITLYDYLDYVQDSRVSKTPQFVNKNNGQKPKELSDYEKEIYVRDINTYFSQLIQPNFYLKSVNGIEMQAQYNFAFDKLKMEGVSKKQNKFLKIELEKYMHLIVRDLEFFNPDSIGIMLSDYLKYIQDSRK